MPITRDTEPTPLPARREPTPPTWDPEPKADRRLLVRFERGDESTVEIVESVTRPTDPASLEIVRFRGGGKPPIVVKLRTAEVARLLEELPEFINRSRAHILSRPRKAAP